MEVSLFRQSKAELDALERKRRLSWLCGVVGVLCVVMLQSPGPGRYLKLPTLAMEAEEPVACKARINYFS